MIKILIYKVAQPIRIVIVILSLLHFAHTFRSIAQLIPAKDLIIPSMNNEMCRIKSGVMSAMKVIRRSASIWIFISFISYIFGVMRASGNSRLLLHSMLTVSLFRHFCSQMNIQDKHNSSSCALLGIKYHRKMSSIFNTHPDCIYVESRLWYRIQDLGLGLVEITKPIGKLTGREARTR